MKKTDQEKKLNKLINMMRNKSNNIKSISIYCKEFDPDNFFWIQYIRVTTRFHTYTIKVTETSSNLELAVEYDPDWLWLKTPEEIYKIITKGA